MQESGGRQASTASPVQSMDPTTTCNMVAISQNGQSIQSYTITGLPPSAALAFLVGCEKYGERHQRDGASPSLWTPSPIGGQTACPPNPLGNFYGLILRIASGATRGEAELETDLRRFGLPMGGALGFDISGAHCGDESVRDLCSRRLLIVG
ncbi:MAG: hypothetical protein H7Y37_10870 [Anaerolineae bacterium]|nr:hypothetical protein [Gloeobacterales cyanobacterium ES-bin-313]